MVAMLMGGYELINGRTGPERLTLHDLKADRDSGTLPESPPGGQFWKVDFSPDSSRIALTTIGQRDRVTIWNVPGRRVERELLLKSPTGGQPSVWVKTFTNDSRQLLTVGNDRTFCLWDIGSGELRAFHRTEPTAVYTFLRFAADGRTFCAATESGTAQVWQMRVSLPKVAAPAARLAAPVAISKPPCCSWSRRRFPPSLPKPRNRPRKPNWPANCSPAPANRPTTTNAM